MVNHKIWLGIKLIVFFSLTIIFVLAVNKILMPKYYYYEDWPTTNTYSDFYRLKRNTVDVIFLGSSHAVSSFNPQTIYDNYGIRSYNLGSEQQSPLISYYWLKESLKYQSPKVVVIDTYTFHKYTDAYVYNDLNCSESAVHKAMDCMRLSPLKYEASKAIEKKDSKQNWLSFLFLNIRYHTRWKELNEKDYTIKEMLDHGGIKGYSALGEVPEGLTDLTFNADDSDKIEAEPMVEIGKEYLENIVELCEENNINLVLVNIPCGESVARYKATKAFADEYGIPYLDFNEKELYEEVGYIAEEDGYNHPNYKGAEKISLYLGSFIHRTYGLEPMSDDSYDKTRELYNHKIQNYHLKETDDLYRYLDMISHEGYVLFVFIPNGMGEYMDEGIIKKWYELGFSTNPNSISGDSHYCAVRADTVVEKNSLEDMLFSGSVCDGTVIYSFTVDTSNMIPQYHKYSVEINGIEYTELSEGMRIIVYDNESKGIVDSVIINSSSEESLIHDEREQ